MKENAGKPMASVSGDSTQLRMLEWSATLLHSIR
jgi:hypothetical protein